MVQKKKIQQAEAMPEFQASINSMPVERKIFVDKSLEAAHQLFLQMGQKGFAVKAGKVHAGPKKIQD